MTFDWELFWPTLAAIGGFIIAWKLILEKLVAKAADWINKKLKL